jgi:hypothetical protein
VALVIIDVSEEHIASIMRMTRLGELEILAATSNRSTLMMEVISFFEMSVLTRAT